MIELEQLMLVIVGIIIGSVLGTEYASWRMTRKLKKTLFNITGFDQNHYDSCLTVQDKQQYIGNIIKNTFAAVFPQESMVPPSPSKIVSLSGDEFFVPQCPKCGYVAAPIRRIVGSTVAAYCPEHGVYHVVIPETEKEKSK